MTPQSSETPAYSKNFREKFKSSLKSDEKFRASVERALAAIDRADAEIKKSRESRQRTEQTLRRFHAITGMDYEKMKRSKKKRYSIERTKDQIKAMGLDLEMLLFSMEPVSPSAEYIDNYQGEDDRIHWKRLGRIVRLMALQQEASSHQSLERSFGLAVADSCFPEHAERRRRYEKHQAANRRRTYAEVVKAARH